MQKTKQCAGCGAQMGSRAQVCPRCGRGSLFGLLAQLFVLGVLLLGIGVETGIVPLAPIQRAMTPAPADTARSARPPRHAPPKSAARRPRGVHREPHQPESVAAIPVLDSQAPAKTVARTLVQVPCPPPDTETDQVVPSRPDLQGEVPVDTRRCERESRGVADTGAEPPSQPDAAVPGPIPGQRVEPSDSPVVEPPAF